MRSLCALVLLAASCSPAFAAGATYNILRSYSGSTFFSGWDYFDGFDNTTNGDVNYLSQANATADGLTFINGAGNAIVKVDNTTFVPFNIKRNSVKIITHDFFPIGSVFVFDALHLPFGCSVWPSFWTMGQDWPAGGEIDIMEGVNKATNDQMTLHAKAGCTQDTSATQLGQTSGADCSAGANSSVGCTVIEKQPNSFGDGFNSNGGGVWAAQFDQSGIFIWFWSRNAIPADVSKTSTQVDTSTWGIPSAAWPASSCNIGEFFAPQQLVIDITLCGDFAGQAEIYQQTCGGPLSNSTFNTCYVDNVINNGTSDYANAFFEIQYVKVFSNSTPFVADGVSGASTILVSDTATGTAPAGTGTGAGGAPASTGTGGSGTSKTNAAEDRVGVAGVRAGLAMWAVTLCAGFVWALL
ncbi:concanavalin A-like lectin/glucanase domain-containing protein [Cubamyces menziesii]|nr:concanavalin A-like lectin/glucanase domain-containing protein [Cubamyces menziesii]